MAVAISEKIILSNSAGSIELVPENLIVAPFEGAEYERSISGKLKKTSTFVKTFVEVNDWVLYEVFQELLNVIYAQEAVNVSYLVRYDGYSDYTEIKSFAGYVVRFEQESGGIICRYSLRIEEI